jgi:hypothetical protein
MIGVKNLLAEGMPEILTAYKQLEASVPADLQDDVVIVRDFTVDLARIVSELETLREFSGLERRLVKLGAIEAGQATLALDKFTRDECGVTLAD